MVWLRVWRKAVLPSILTAASASATVASRVLASDFGQQPLGARLAVYAGGVLTLCIGFLAVTSGVTAIRERTKTDAYTILLVALAKIVDMTGVDASDIGLSAFWVKRSVWRPWRKRQNRLTGVRLSTNFPPLIGWDWSKGVVGRCWKEKHNRVAFVRSDAPYLNCSQSEWNKASEEERWGMNYQEWTDTQRYALILAYPVQAGEKYKGCVSLDATRDEHVQNLFSEPVWALLGDAATAMEKSLGGA